MLWMLNHLEHYPRRERFRLSEQIADSLFMFHRHLVYASKSQNTLHYLQQADAEFTLLRSYLRLAVELKYTTPRQFQYIGKQTVEIGKLLGGWMKKA